MDFLFFLIFVVLIVSILYILVCLTIIVKAGSDILTFVAVHLGKSPKPEYTGKVIWITGASSGIGEALAYELIRNGAKVVLSARRESELKRVKLACLKANPNAQEGNILLLPFDMNDIPAHEGLFKEVLSHFGKLDVLISNAGRSQRALWHKIELSVDKELFDLNVFSLVHLNRIVVKHFLHVGGGHVVVNSSLAGKYPAPYSASYTASKHAIQGYFCGLRNETRQDNIHVTVLCPGPVFSNFLREAFTGNQGEKLLKEHTTKDNRMTAERFAKLAVAAMANKVEEPWIGPFPAVAIVYFNQYFPYFGSKFQRWMGKNGMFLKLRDGRNTLKED